MDVVIYQLFSVVQTVATLTKHDEDKTQALEAKIVRLNATLQGKEQEISTLQETVRGLERTNQQLKEEQESLKTVNELRLEDINRVNSDLQQQVFSNETFLNYLFAGCTRFGVSIRMYIIIRVIGNWAAIRTSIGCRFPLWQIHPDNSLVSPHAKRKYEFLLIYCWEEDIL